MANDGKWLERMVQDALHDWQCERRSFFHRFPDSHDARGFLPAQPGDFLWLLPDRPAYLLEAKSTEKSATLKSLLDPGQCGKHRLWQRAGHQTAFIYGDRATGKLAWYRGEDVVKPPIKAPLWEGQLRNMADMVRFIAL